MKTRLRFWIVAVALALLVVAPFLYLFLPAEALAGPPPQAEDGYRTMRRVITEQITDATAAESTDGSTLIPDRALQTFGNSTIIVNVDFSGAVDDTLVVFVLLYNKDASGNLEWTRAYQPVTATAGVITDAAGDFVAGSLYFDTSAASHYEVRHGLPSGGSNVDLTWWSYGAVPDKDPE